MNSSESLSSAPKQQSSSACQSGGLGGILADEMIAALSAGDAKRVAHLVTAHAPIDIAWPDGKSSTALHFAASLTSSECLTSLLRGETKPIFSENDDGDTPLHVAARKARSIASVLLLVSVYGARSGINSHRNTFLHLLMHNTHVEKAEMMDLVHWLFARADFRSARILNAVNANGSTAYDLATRYREGDADLLEYLLSHGASSGRSIRANEINGWVNKEEGDREVLEQQEEDELDSIHKYFVYYTANLEKCLKRIVRAGQNETEKREKLCEKEAASRRRLSKKCSAGAASILAVEKARQEKLELEAASLLQRIGRGNCARKDMRRLMLVRLEERRALEEERRALEEERRAREEERRALEEETQALEEEKRVSASKAEETPFSSSAPPVEEPDVTVLTVPAPASETVSQSAPPSEERPHSPSAEQKAAGRLILWTYRAHRKRRMSRAAVTVQKHYRGYLTRAGYRAVRSAILALQHWWRHTLRRKNERRAQAVKVILNALQSADFGRQRLIFLAEGTAVRQRDRIRGITQSVTQLIWRENFCSAFRDIVFFNKCRQPPLTRRTSPLERWKTLTQRIEPYVILAQVTVSLFLLIYMGCVPRTRSSNKHNKVDIAFICVQVVLVFLLPLSPYRAMDFAVVITALVCAAAKAYGGAIVITLLLLKIPFLVRAYAPQHSGTRTYCRAMRYTVLYLVAFGPFGVAGVGATVRGAAANSLLLSSRGNWGRVFLYLYSTVAPQYAVAVLLKNGVGFVDDREFPVLNMAHSTGLQKLHGVTDENGDSVDLLVLRMPPVQVIFCNAVLCLYCWAAILVGTHSAIRSHYDISDETKLKANKHRFRNASKLELLDAHRAANMEALGQKVDGVMWEADVRAAKDAVDASHYDHNANHTVHRFVRRVQDSVAQGNLRIEGLTRKHDRNKSGGAHSGREPIPGKELQKWDCRNEDPRSRGTYDVEVIEAALGMVERKGAGERFFERQWVGSILRRETTVILIGMLVMASVRPNLLPMEVSFSSVLALELVLSLYFLRVEFIMSHYLRLLVRIICIVLGYVPALMPYVAFRSLRLLEGWSLLYMLPGMVRWGLLYCLITFVTMWMVAFVAALQFSKVYDEATRNSSDHLSRDRPQPLCDGRSNCLAISLRELVLPAWTAEHIAPGREAPLMALLVLAFQLLFIPFFFTIALHPLLQLSSFIGRFLRLVVQSLHKDVLDYLDSYLEGESWFFHWRINIGIPASIITKLKMWIYDSHRKNIFLLPVRGLSSSFSMVGMQPQITFVNPFARNRTTIAGHDGPSVMNEIVCKGEFSTFRENEARDAYVRPVRLQKLRKLTRKPYLHYINLVMTLASVAFLWVSNPTYSRTHAVTIIAVVIHFLSIFTAVSVFPKDMTVVFTVVGCVSLFIGVVMILLPGHKYRDYYCLRFISLVRFAQLQIPPLLQLKLFIKTYVKAAVRILFPAVVLGGLSYIAELIRAQIYLVSSALDFGNRTFDSNESSVWKPKHLSFAETLLLSRCKPMALKNDNLTLSSSANQTYVIHCTRTSRPGVTETSRLFSHNFREDAYIFYSIYSYWVLPALCVSSCVAHLYWMGANQIDTRRLTVSMIPLLEDPVTVAQFRPDSKAVRYVTNLILAISLVFCCIFSPTTSITSDDFNLFFGFELAFNVIGLFDSMLRVAFAIHRSGSSWARWKHLSRHEESVIVVLGDSFLVVCEVIELLYYSISVPLCATFLRERNDCLISSDDYATYFVTLRFIFLLRVLPRPYILSFLRDSVIVFFGLTTIIVYFIGSASALADLAASADNAHVTPSLWRQAFGDLFRHTFTFAVPQTFGSRWKPVNATAVALDMLSNNVDTVYVDTNYHSGRLLFILATIGKAFLASSAGLGIAATLVPLRAHVVRLLPPKSARLYKTLQGGMQLILKYGSSVHDDMRPVARRKIQQRKFNRIFTHKGIPSWALPHLLEELDICRPSRQRRFMFALRQLLTYLPISEKRQSMVKEYMNLWDSYRSGAPQTPRFDTLPVYPPPLDEELDTPVLTKGVSNPYASPQVSSESLQSHRPSQQHEQYVAPLRLIQALSLFELGFPADSSVGSKLWLDFFAVVQKVRAATLLQSLWRMYRQEREFDASRSGNFQEKMSIAALRRSFRKYRISHSIRFRCHESFKDALIYEREAFNVGTGHFDVLNRFRGHYKALAPTSNFVLREKVTRESIAVTANTVSQYVSQYLQQSARRTSLSVMLSPSRMDASREVSRRRGVEDSSPSVSKAAF